MRRASHPTYALQEDGNSARYARLLACSRALRDCSWLDHDPVAGDELAEAKQQMLDLLKEIDAQEQP